MPTKPDFHGQLEPDYEGGDGDGNEEEEPDLFALALGVQAEGKDERDEVAQTLEILGSFKAYVSFKALGTHAYLPQ